MEINSFINAGYKVAIVICHDGTVYRYGAINEISEQLMTLYINKFYLQTEDEKMYGPPVNGMDEKTLEEEIKKLEKEIYGDKAILANVMPDKKPMIYDVDLGRLIPNFK